MINKIFLIIFSLIFICEGCQINRTEELKSDAKPEEVLNFTHKKIEKLKLKDLFQKSKLVFIGRYEKVERIGKSDGGYFYVYYKIGIYPLFVLKGNVQKKTVNFIFLCATTPGFGYENNYGKRFLIFLDSDKFKQDNFIGSTNSLKTILLDKQEP
jgi:hypothetical protein